jgi:hypothetical protein
VVQIGWVDTSDAINQWPEAEDLTEGVLCSHLQAAYEQCVAFLPPAYLVEWPSQIPDRWKQAQMQQARALWRASVTGSGDQLGGQGLSVTVFPMDWTVKNLLRPSKVGRVS